MVSTVFGRRDIKMVSCNPKKKVPQKVRLLCNNLGQTYSWICYWAKILIVSWNLVPRLIRIYGIQWCGSVFVLERKYSFWANFVQKFNILFPRGNLVSKLIRICRNQWWFLLFPLSTGDTILGANLVPKFKIICLEWNLVPRIRRISRIQCCCLRFSVFDRK